MWFLRFDWNDAASLGWATMQEARVFRSEDGRAGCVHVEELADEGRAPARPLAAASPVQLRLLLEVPGVASGRDAPWHYIVATDVLAEQEDDFNAWYEREHLPGLAAVPGTAHAARYRVVEGAGPRYHACYDLADRSAFNSPEWLAVRAMPWSSRVRPAFLNTRRTMYRRVDALRPGDAKREGRP